MGSKISEKGRLYVSKGKRVFVMSPPTNCPRIIVSGNSVSVKDDYNGRIKLNKLVSKLL